MTQAYPLQWPHGWPRTRAGNYERAKFGKTSESRSADGSISWKTKQQLSVADAYKRMVNELVRLDARFIIISSNLELNRDGSPRSSQREPSDSGVGVYFKLKGKDRSLACDKWDRVANNMVAIAKHIEALRGQERWGVGTLEQAFTGYAALPPPTTWQSKLSLRADATLTLAEESYRILASKFHPDMPGGSHEKMAELNNAITQARRELA